VSKCCIDFPPPKEKVRRNAPKSIGRLKAGAGNKPLFNLWRVIPLSSRLRFPHRTWYEIMILIVPFPDNFIQQGGLHSLLKNHLAFIMQAAFSDDRHSDKLTG
jgi:hypothetical protein